MLFKSWELAGGASDVTQKMVNVLTLTCAGTKTAREEAPLTITSFFA